MRYEDYKIENYVFMNKEYENWTEEEKQEVLDTFPESKEAPEILKALELVLSDINSGILKTSKYGDINKMSAKAYANRHDYIYYGNRVNGRYYGHGADRLYVVLDGNIKELLREYDVKDAIRYLTSGIGESRSYMGNRFDAIVSRYTDKEVHDYDIACKQSYEELNKERIDASRKAELMLNQTRIEVLTNFYPNGDGDYQTYNCYREDARKWFKGYDYTYRNQHGELTMCGEIVSKEDADKITEMLLDLNIRIGYMIDKCNAEMKLLKLKYKDIADENKEKGEN